MTISEKVAYLKGLAEGLGLEDDTSKEAKVISVMIGILEEIGLTLEDMDEALEVIEEEMDAISDDLAEVEDVLFEDEDEDDDDHDHHHHGHDDLDEDDFFETDCPNCNEVLVIDESVLLAGNIECPACKEKFSIDFSDCGCGDDCSCGDEAEGGCGCK